MGCEGIAYIRFNTGFNGFFEHVHQSSVLIDKSGGFLDHN
jgi:hypothetical protein